MTSNRLPLWGVPASLVLFALAMSMYPGGYDVRRNFISSLFAPTTPTGAANTSRYIAVGAMFVFCVSVAVLFNVVSSRTRSPVHRKTLQIGGIGSMVYAFLV